MTDGEESVLESQIQAASEVNDDDALNTLIEGSEMPSNDNLEPTEQTEGHQSSSNSQPSSPKLSQKGGGVSSSSPPLPGPQTTTMGGRELIWKTADGTEKRLLLPIEMIQEDVMDDPEHLFNTLSPAATKEERAKMLSALQEMQGSIR